VETPWLLLARQEAKTIEHQQMRAVCFSVKKNGFTPYFVHRESNTNWMLRQASKLE
jgi:hypothetical protein